MLWSKDTARELQKGKSQSPRNRDELGLTPAPRDQSDLGCPCIPRAQLIVCHSLGQGCGGAARGAEGHTGFMCQSSTHPRCPPLTPPVLSPPGLCGTEQNLPADDSLLEADLAEQDRAAAPLIQSQPPALPDAKETSQEARHRHTSVRSSDVFQRWEEEQHKLELSMMLF